MSLGNSATTIKQGAKDISKQGVRDISKQGAKGISKQGAKDTETKASNIKTGSQ